MNVGAQRALADGRHLSEVSACATAGEHGIVACDCRWLASADCVHPQAVAGIYSTSGIGVSVEASTTSEDMGWLRGTEVGPIKFIRGLTTLGYTAANPPREGISTSMQNVERNRLAISAATFGLPTAIVIQLISVSQRSVNFSAVDVNFAKLNFTVTKRATVIVILRGYNSSSTSLEYSCNQGPQPPYVAEVAVNCVRHGDQKGHRHRHSTWLEFVVNQLRLP